MANKKKSVPVENNLTEDEKKVAERVSLINQYNKENEGQSYLDFEPATEEDMDKAKTDFEAAQKALNTKTFVIADKANAKRVAEFLKNWNEKYAAWEKDQWVGVVKFNNYITDFLDQFAKEDQDLIVDLGALLYLDTLMMKPFGIGLAAAKEMEAIDDEYNKILEVVDDYKKKADEESQAIRKKQEVWAAACAGFRLHFVTDDSADGTKIVGPVEEKTEE